MAWKFSNRSLKNMRGIHPDLRRVMDRALEISPLDFTVIEGLRTVERQEQLVASGASTTMNSRHLTGHAVDLLPFGPNGAEFNWALYYKLAPAVKQAALDCGVAIEWGGDWDYPKDGPHFELAWSEYPKEAFQTTGTAPTPRTSPAQSKTVQAGSAQAVTAAGGAIAAIGALDGIAQIVAVGGCVVIGLAAAFILRERLRKWAAGDR